MNRLIPAFALVLAASGCVSSQPDQRPKVSPGSVAVGMTTAQVEAVAGAPHHVRPTMRGDVRYYRDLAVIYRGGTVTGFQHR